MPDRFEEWLVELAKNENYSVLDKLPEFLRREYAKAADVRAERSRLAVYFRNHAPRSPFSALVLEAILNSD